jgi:RHS repeat-associated protein
VGGRGLVHSIRDRNGNLISFLYNSQHRVREITDSLGRKVTVTYGATSDEIKYYGFNGDGAQNGWRTIVVVRAPLDESLDEGMVLQTNRELFPGLPDIYEPDRIFNPRVVAWVELPNGTRYDFRYNAYGELTKVQLPTGGIIEYTWASGTGDPGGVHDVNAAWEWIPDFAIHRRVTSRKVINYSALEQWTEYVVPEDCNSSEGICVDARHLKPDGNLIGRERHYFVGDPLDSFNQASCDYPGWRDGRETVVEVYDAGGFLQRAIASTWEQHRHLPWWPGPAEREPATDVRLTKAVTILDTHESSKVTYAYDDYNNVTRKDEFDFGASSAARSTETSYEDGTAYVHPYYAHIRDLPKVTKVWEGTVLRSHEEYFYDEEAVSRPPGIIRLEELPSIREPYRGNLTRTWRYLDKPRQGQPQYVETKRRYDAAGNVVRIEDPETHSTTIEYIDNFGRPNGGYQDQTGYNTYAFPTRVWNAKGHETRTQYDYYLGRPTDRMDANNVVTSFFYDDYLDRLTLVERASNPGWTDYLSRTGFRYEDGRIRRRIHSYKDRTAAGGADQHKSIEFDELGREWNAFSHEGTGIATRSRYDARGRKFMVQAPMPSSEDGPWTTTEFDVLDRPRRVITPDGATVWTAYEGPITRVTDAVGRVRQSRADALGRVVEVIEDPGGGLGLRTVYDYDAMDRLTTVRQPPQPHRTFEYDTLGRLTVATNPESGVVSYQYDRNGSMVERKDARGWKTITRYDSLNRPDLKRYEGDGGVTEQVAYAYDVDPWPGTFSKGRLTEVSNATSRTIYNHDPLGRVFRSVQTTDGRSYVFKYRYDRADNLIREDYPTGRVVHTEYDDLDRVTKVSSPKYRDYASDFSYSPHGGVTKMKLGNGLWESARFNSRLQPEHVGLGRTETTPDLLSLQYQYWPEGAGSQLNDGNVWKHTIVAGGLTQTQYFSYDSVDRLWWGYEPGVWFQRYDYDRWGNRAVTGTVIDPSLTPGNLALFNPASNRLMLAHESYDAAGNQVKDAPGRISTYDAENRQIRFASTKYAYDGEGRRVRREGPPSFTVFVYDAFGRLAAEYSGIPAQPPSARYLTLDPLGSTRIVTDQQGAVVSRRDYLPFGEEIPVSWGVRAAIGGYGATDGIKKRFTSKERDLESGLDYFGARYHSGAQGRFTSVDPLYKFTEHTFEPQQWNRYAYVQNNPLRYVDADGRAIETPWDAVNVGLGAASLVANISAGNVGGALLDAAGLAYDLTATAVPGLPGGAGTLIKAGRAGDKLLDAARTADKIGDTARVGDAMQAVDKIGDAGLPSDALVCRGGTCTADRFANGSGVTVNEAGELSGVSVNSAPGKTVQELTTTIPNKQVGVTTVGEVRQAGGTVTPKPTTNNPYHCELCGITPKKAEELFTPTIKNPNQ